MPTMTPRNDPRDVQLNVRLTAAEFDAIDAYIARVAQEQGLTLTRAQVVRQAVARLVGAPAVRRARPASKAGGR